MSVSTRRTRGLPSEYAGRSTDETGRVLVRATPEQDNYDRDVPVASDDEDVVQGEQETTVTGHEADGTQERQLVSTHFSPPITRR